MSKKKTPMPPKRQTAKVIIGVVLVLCLAAGILAQWRGTLPFSYFTAAPPAPPTTTASPTPNPFVAKKAAKEYIYVGGKLQVIEEPARPVGSAAFDFTNNGSGDVVVWRPSEGNWYVLDLVTNQNTLQQLGASGETIVPGDYDGDGKTDIAIWKPNPGVCSSNGYNCGWYIKLSGDTTGSVSYYADWGQSGDIPVPADYDGDGKMDRAVWRPSNGQWYILNSGHSSNPNIPEQSVIGWGDQTDKPVPADYDGDGKADIAVFRPSENNWYIKRSSDDTTQTRNLGASGSVLAPADYDGDGKADCAYWLSTDGQWRILPSSSPANAVRVVSWGQAGDQIVPADYDGDGRVDIAVWRPSEGTWYIKKSSDGTTIARGWGQQGDIPVPAAYVR